MTETAYNKPLPKLEVYRGILRLVCPGRAALPALQVLRRVVACAA